MTKTHYLWDFDNDSYLMEKDGTGATTAVYTNEPVPNGKLISQRRENSTSYYHFDGQHSTRQLTDQEQNVTDMYTYTCFGETVAHSGTTANPFRYTGLVGYYMDEVVSQYYVRSRSYQQSGGRWISPDSHLIVDRLSRFVYANNNPLNLTDPSGLFSQRVKGNACSSFCGVFALVTEWVLDDTETNGFIIQRVCRSGKVTHCPPNEDMTPPCTFRVPPNCTNKGDIRDQTGVQCYYELWRVFKPPGATASDIYIKDPFDTPPSSGGQGVDVFGFFGCEDECDKGATRGQFNFTGIAFFVPLDLISDSEREKLRQEFHCPPDERALKVACKLCSGLDARNIFAKLRAKKGVKSIEKSAHVKWDCCGCDCPSKNTRSDFDIKGTKGKIPFIDDCSAIEKAAGTAENAW